MSNTEQQTIESLRQQQAARQTGVAPRQQQTITGGFSDSASFEMLCRAAKALSSSDLVPATYRSVITKKIGDGYKNTDNPAGYSNCIVALNMANRMQTDPLLIMQNLYVIEGRPSFSSQFLISLINSSGLYSTDLQFDVTEKGEPVEVEVTVSKWQKVQGKNQKVDVVEKFKVRHQSCVAWAIDKKTGRRVEGIEVSIQMAIDEGWLARNGSKWQTIPDLMLRYRSAAFFCNLNCPQVKMGLPTSEEVREIYDAEQDDAGSYSVSTQDLRQEAKGQVDDDWRHGEAAPAAEQEQEVDQEPEQESDDYPEHQEEEQDEREQPVSSGFDLE